MKVVCIKDTELTGTWTLRDTKIDGLTKDKVYNVFAVPIVNNLAWFDGTTLIQPKDIKFLIFDDNGIWKCYDPQFFEPKE